MYQSYFGFQKRPFNATPDVECFIPLAGACEAAENLAACASQGRGIGVLSAASGLGKTLICQRVKGELESDLSVVFLPSANFLTRRSLLQAILFELGHSYVRMGDQELRLAILSALRRLRPGYRGMALIVDEAHLLAPRMLEELRTLTNFAEGGEPLVRLIVSGNLQLEESLSLPLLDSFNQRVGSHATLQPLTRKESAEYIERRIAWAGANVPDVFDNEALRFICEASDGSPRCLNQLCEHSLLLGSLRSQRPIRGNTVRDALEELKQLPLTWNNLSGSMSSGGKWEACSDTHSLAPIEPLSVSTGAREDLLIPRSSLETGRTKTDDASREFVFEDMVLPERVGESSPGAAAIEFGGPADSSEDSAAIAFELASEVVSGVGKRLTTMAPYEITGESIDCAPPMSAVIVRQESLTVDEQARLAEEEIVVDRYAALDAAIGRLTRTMVSARAASREVASRDEERVPVAKPSDETLPILDGDDEDLVSRFDIILPEEEHEEKAETIEAPVLVGATHSQSHKPTNDDRPYQFLFSELRRRYRR